MGSPGKKKGKPTVAAALQGRRPGRLVDVFIQFLLLGGVIIATYLPLYRAYELELFKKNVEVTQAKRAVVCVDYFASDELKPLVEGYLRDLGLEAEILAGNWQNCSSCVLRLLKLVVEEGGDG